MTITHLSETDSTNNWLRHNCGDEDMTVWTDFQTAGRGCGRNTWESERAKNLTFSMLIHPTNIEASRQFLISMGISTAICRAVSLYINSGVSIKWPNDIYVDDRKLCGILIENNLSGHMIKDSIIGIGLNVNQQQFLSDAPNPVSLRQLTGCEIDRERLLHQIIDAFTLAEDPRPEYRSLLYRQTGFHAYRDQNGEFRAEIIGVADDGMLSLRDTEGRVRQYAFKEVAFVI